MLKNTLHRHFPLVSIGLPPWSLLFYFINLCLVHLTNSLLSAIQLQWKSLISTDFNNNDRQELFLKWDFKLCTNLYQEITTSIFRLFTLSKTINQLQLIYLYSILNGKGSHCNSIQLSVLRLWAFVWLLVARTCTCNSMWSYASLASKF